MIIIELRDGTEFKAEKELDSKKSEDDTVKVTFRGVTKDGKKYSSLTIIDETDILFKLVEEG